MRRFAGACRFVFNRALARQNENHEVGNKYIPYGKMASWLVEWKNATETQWLKDAPSQPLQQSLKDLERAYKNFFQNRAAFPRFKKRGQNDVFRYPQGVKLDQENSRIFLPKLGWMRYRNSRQVTGVVKNVTVSQSCGKWYISIQTESEVSTPVHPSASMVGRLYLAVVIDLWSRAVIGWSMSPRMTAQLACDALQMALWRRKRPRNVIVHTDRGGQYCSADYQAQLKRHNLRGKLLSFAESGMYPWRTLYQPGNNAGNGV